MSHHHWHGGARFHTASRHPVSASRPGPAIAMYKHPPMIEKLEKKTFRSADRFGSRSDQKRTTTTVTIHRNKPSSSDIGRA